MHPLNRHWSCLSLGRPCTPGHGQHPSFLVLGHPLQLVSLNAELTSVPCCTPGPLWCAVRPSCAQTKKSSLMTLGTMGRNQNKCFLHCLKKPQRAHVHLVPVGSKRVKWICFWPGFWVRVGKVAKEVRSPLLVVLGAPHTHTCRKRNRAPEVFFSMALKRSSVLKTPPCSLIAIQGPSPWVWGQAEDPLSTPTSSKGWPGRGCG